MWFSMKISFHFKAQNPLSIKRIFSPTGFCLSLCQLLITFPYRTLSHLSLLQLQTQQRQVDHTEHLKPLLISLTITVTWLLLLIVQKFPLLHHLFLIQFLSKLATIDCLHPTDSLFYPFLLILIHKLIQKLFSLKCGRMQWQRS